MKIGFSLRLTDEMLQYSKLFNSFEKHLADFFQKKDYGDSLTEVNINISCVSAEFSKFFEPGKPKYIANFDKLPIDSKVKLRNILDYSIQLNYEKLIKLNAQVALEELNIELLNSLSVFDKIQSKIKNFDIVNFKKDFTYFINNNYIEDSN